MRLTNTMRDNIFSKALSNVPTTDYLAQLHTVVQRKVFDMAPMEVRVLCTMDDGRRYVRAYAMHLSVGNHNEYRLNDLIYGVGALIGVEYDRVVLRLDARVVDFLPEGDPRRVLAQTVIDSGLFDKHIRQLELLASVKQRLKATLAGATTTDALRKVLEPELHHLIPTDPVRANLPALAAPVVDDLRRLGAVFPDTPKMETQTNEAQ